MEKDSIFFFRKRMNKSLVSVILTDDLQDFERKTTKKELGSILTIYASELLRSEELACLKYIARFIPLKNFRDARGQTLLHHAVALEDISTASIAKVCSYLIYKECSPEIKDNNGHTPLDIAISNGRMFLFSENRESLLKK
jgi:ankyrin repeat protein